jgi:hypothetical protein
MATIGVSQTSALGSDSAKAKESASSIFALIDRKSRIDSSSDDGMVLADVAGELELCQVCFSYPSRPSVQIFRDLSLRIPPGKVSNNHLSSLSMQHVTCTVSFVIFTKVFKLLFFFCRRLPLLERAAVVNPP